MSKHSVCTAWRMLQGFFYRFFVVSIVIIVGIIIELNTFLCWK